ncbi:hypothetical protein HII36_29695 [Nonomuraea sp. NN258]|uniref:hypothetical protein n=1 Tax=Nonomuraea antri TaxID=2730852 RepID=UPI0015698B97|nr:hypothetical protein [Nonomuraea antri]NRQ35975.1 hypothetical protein [Nonomuraea antri]
MPASVRSASFGSAADNHVTVARPTSVAAGDVLYAVHVCTHPLAAQPVPTGWADIRLDEDAFLATRILRLIATGSEPSAWTFEQADGGDGVVVIAAVAGADPAASIRIAIAAAGEGVTTPTVTPAAASHLELRIPAVFCHPDPMEVAGPAGYQLRGQEQGGQAFAALASRQISSSSPSGVKEFPLSAGSPFSVRGITISIPSAGLDVEVPPIPPDTPGVGDGLYLYRFSRLFGGHLGDLAVHQPSFEKRISRRGQINVGNFSSTFPISDENAGDLAAKIVPRYRTDLLRGPGVTVCDIWRAGVHWGRYWITGANIRKSRRQTPVLSLSGASLEAFFQYVMLEESLTPYVGVDRVEVGRQLIDHMQLQPFADLGLILQAGDSGSVIDRTFEAYQAMYGQHLASTTDGVDGYEWMINSEFGPGGLEFHWKWGVPLGDPNAAHTYTDSPHGGNILDWSIEWAPLQRGTRWRVRGDTIDTDASTVSKPLISAAFDSPHLATGVWPRIDRIVDRPGIRDVGQLDEIAEQLALTSGGAPPVFSITVLLGEEPSIHPNMLGDPARIVMTNEFFKRVNGGAGLNERRRILGMRVTATGRENGRDEAELFIDDQAVE